jgi:hypothetical protein
LAKIDIVFALVNHNIDSVESNNEKLLIRYEFFEAILRIAGLKYRDTGIAKTYAEAFQMIIE